MLYEFVTTYRASIIDRARQKLTARPWPSASPDELENGVPLFLTQLSEKLRSESTGAAHSPGAIGSTATRHGRDLMALGFSVSQVVHDYGDICQAITEIAIEQNAPITTDEFKTLNGCLDTAIAEAVTEHARITAVSRSHEEIERSGHVAHETRDLLHTAMLAYQSLKQGTVAINGSTGAVLGRSLMSLRDLVDSTLSEIRIAANHQRRGRVSVTSFLNDLAVAGRLHAESRGLQLVIEPGYPAWAITADPQGTRIGGDESPEQRLQVHTRWRARRAQSTDKQRGTPPDRGGRRVRRHPRQRRGPVSVVRPAEGRRPDGSWLGAVDCSKGCQGTWWGHPHSEFPR